jgi:L-lactate utilization protein LutB
MDLSEKVQKTIDNLKNRHINALFIKEKSQVLERVMQLIPVDAAIGFGNSQTLKELKISEALAQRGNIVFDKTFGKSPEEKRLLKKKALIADWFVTGTNALSQQGHLINIDHSGNRVAAMLYGPEHVLVVVGLNKIADSLEQAIQRARMVAAPLNAARAGFNPPCRELKRCIDCRSTQRVCNSLVTIEGQTDENRMTVLIVGEQLGF